MIFDETGSPRCTGVLINQWTVLAAGCSPAPYDLVEVGSVTGSGATTQSHSYVFNAIQTTHFALMGLAVQVPWYGRPNVPMLARAALPSEDLVLVSNRGDGSARATAISERETTVAVAPFLEPAEPTFSSDGKLLGFCQVDACGVVKACASVYMALQQQQGIRVLYTMRNLLWGDSTGDGHGDATAITLDGIALRRSLSTGLSEFENWLPVAFYGNRINLLGDINGDGRDDLLVANDTNFGIRFSSGSAYAPPTAFFDLISISFIASLGQVDGFVGDDLVTLDGTTIAVRTSLGNGFGSAALWADGIDLGFRSLALADVTRDGLDDVIVVRPHSIEVRASTGTSFATASTWLADAPDSGAPGWFFADVTGDGAADAVLLNAQTSRVFVASDGQFVAPEDGWRMEIPLGERDNVFTDVTGDGYADAVVHHHANVIVYPSIASDFGPPLVWFSEPYFGGL